MMIKKLALFIILTFTTSLYAHTLLINVLDNDDGTITVEGVYSTGEDAPGAMIRLESLVSGKVLYKKRLPFESEITVNIPKEPYQIVLDGGPGHTVVKKGIEPEGGYSQDLVEQANENLSVGLSKAENNTGEWSNISVVLFLVCIVLFTLAIYFSFKNTNRIIKDIKESNSN